MNAVFFNRPKEKKMNTLTQPQAQEINLQERDTEALSDQSLPAAQVIEEQNNDAEQNNSPRFIP